MLTKLHTLYLAAGTLVAACAAASEVVQLQPQPRGAPIAIAGEQLVWWREGWIESWDLANHRRVDHLPAPETAHALGTNGDSVLVALNDSEARAARLLKYRDFTWHVVPAPEFYWFASAERLTGAGAGEFWITEGGRELVRYRYEPQLVREATTQWSMNQALTFTRGARPGTALFQERGSLVILRGDGSRNDYALTSEMANPVLLAPGESDGVAWLVSGGMLFRAALAGRVARVERRLPCPDVHHLTHAGDGVALLEVQLRAGAWQGVTVTQLDARGDVRWRRHLAAPRAAAAWLAGSDRYVAALVGGTLQVFRASDGAAVLDETSRLPTP